MNNFEYSAFISYAHEDKDIACWLQQALEGYNLGEKLTSSSNQKFEFKNNKIAPVFMDHSDLNSGTGFSDQIREALASSAALIVVCSPCARKSKWVNKEIKEYKKNGNKNKIFSLIVSGRTERGDDYCFPEELEELDPLAVDLRENGISKKEALLRLLAGILNKDIQTVLVRDKKRTLLRNFIIGIVALVFFIIGGLIYNDKKNDKRLVEGAFNALFYGQGLGQDNVEAVKWSRLAAERGYASAQNYLGNMYHDSLGVPQDNVEAVKWYRLAAEQGDAIAQNNLGFMYLEGRGVPQDDVEAVKWSRLAAEQGYAIAQNNLGLLYHKGRGVPQDNVEAVKWYHLAAEQGDAAAQLNLGYMYDKFTVVPQDYPEAVKWYRLAAEQGDATAKNNLGLMYLEGRGVPQDDVKAVEWYRLAAEQGYAEAQFNLGVLYGAGRGVPLDYAEALKWITLAAAQGRNTEMTDVKKLLENKMTKQQIAKAQELSRDWMEKQQ